MPPLMLTDAADSKRVELANYSSTEAQRIYLRLRLEVLLKVLLGGQLLISEGWALDSLPFLRVAREVASAATGLRKGTNPLHGIEEFSPFAMELRQDGDYAGTLLRYLRRPDIRWSGYGTLRDDAEQASTVAARVSEAINTRESRSTDRLAEIMAEALDNEDVGEAIGEVARYFGKRERERIVRVNPDPRGFQKWFEKSLELVRLNAGADEQSRHVAKPLVNFANQLRSKQIDLSTSSPAMRFAEETLDETECKAVFHLINFAYMRVSAEAASASVSAPSLDYLASGVLLFADYALRAEPAPTEQSGELTFDFSLDAERALSERLISSNWMPIWEAAIALSLSSEWRARVETLREEARKGLQGASLTNTRTFRRLADMLEKECPELCLRHSGTDRLGLRMNAKWLEIAKDTSDRGIIGGAGYLLGEVILPGSGLLGAGAAAWAASTAKPILPEIKRAGLNPLSRDGIWSTRSTIFDIIRR